MGRARIKWCHARPLLIQCLSPRRPTSPPQAACIAASSVLVVPLAPRKLALPGALPPTVLSHHRCVVPCDAACCPAATLAITLTAPAPRSAALAAAAASAAWCAGVLRRLAGAAALAGRTTVGPDSARLVSARRRLWTSRSCGDRRAGNSTRRVSVERGKSEQRTTGRSATAFHLRPHAPVQPHGW